MPNFENVNIDGNNKEKQPQTSNPYMDMDPNFMKNFNMNMFMNMDPNNLNTNNNNPNNNNPNNNNPNNNNPNNNNNTNTDSKKIEDNNNKNSNPFVDAFSEMKQNTFDPKDIMNLFSGMNLNVNMPEGNQGQGLNSDNLKEEPFENIMGLYDILSKLSEQKEVDPNLSEEEKDKQLKNLFENLLEFLLKSEMLAEPLLQIKTSVLNYLSVNKDKLKKEDEEKYISILDYIEVINSEITKKEPNKPLIIDTFFKLHEMSNLDNNILDQMNPNFKEFSDLFAKKN